MNYLSHYHYDEGVAPAREEGGAYFRVGVMLPDLLSAVDRRARVNFEATEEALHAAGDRVEERAFYAGLLRHEEADKHFHTGAYFERETGHLKRALRSQDWKASRVRCWFLAHIALEILLDSRLLHADGDLPDRFYADLAATEHSVWIPWLDGLLRAPAPKLAQGFGIFMERRIAEKYRSIDQLVAVIERVMVRAKQPELKDSDRRALGDVLGEARPLLSLPSDLAGFA